MTVIRFRTYDEQTARGVLRRVLARGTRLQELHVLAKVDEEGVPVWIYSSAGCDSFRDTLGAVELLRFHLEDAYRRCIGG